ncbi:MAG: protein jag [Syntrophobacterales bacterium]|nr:protein jag [Syntrophobacterales bacterium]
MDTKTLEIEEKTIDAAIKKACEEFNLPREKLNIDILSEGASGFLGIVGSKKARIKASPMFINLDLDNPQEEKSKRTIKQSDFQEGNLQKDEETEESLTIKAKERLDGILKRMGIDFPVHVKETPESITLTIEGDGSGLLIGRGGQTLDALQYMVNKTIDKNGKSRKRIILDTEDYRKKRGETLVALAKKLGEKVKRTGKPVTVSPMNSHDRRIVHMALQGDRQLTTRSRGEGTFRKIIILPSRKG